MKLQPAIAYKKSQSKDYSIIAYKKSRSKDYSINFIKKETPAQETLTQVLSVNFEKKLQT